jgi:hypothetical protein
MEKDVPIWKEVSCPKIKTMISLTFLMGIIEKPSINNYWETHSMMNTPLQHLCFSDPYKVVKDVKVTRLG